MFALEYKISCSSKEIIINLGKPRMIIIPEKMGSLRSCRTRQVRVGIVLVYNTLAPLFLAKLMMHSIFHLAAVQLLLAVRIVRMMRIHPFRITNGPVVLVEGCDILHPGLAVVIGLAVVGSVVENCIVVWWVEGRLLQVTATRIYINYLGRS